MKRIILAALVATGLASGPAIAAEPQKGAVPSETALTADAQKKITAAVQAEGCSGGSISRYEGVYTVTNATCGEGTFTLTLNNDFEVDKKTKM